MALPAPVPAAVTVGEGDPRRSRVVVTGALDADVATSLCNICAGAVAGASQRLELDLSAVTDTTPEGVGGLARCLSLGRHLPLGVGVTVANDAGRRALLDSMKQL